jgi:hypothetical protein
VGLRIFARTATASTEMLRYTTLSNRPSEEDTGHLTVGTWACRVTRMDWATGFTSLDHRSAYTVVIMDSLDTQDTQDRTVKDCLSLSILMITTQTMSVHNLVLFSATSLTSPMFHDQPCVHIKASSKVASQRSLSSRISRSLG